jgi:hypothetical protein
MSEEREVGRDRGSEDMDGQKRGRERRLGGGRSEESEGEKKWREERKGGKRRKE